MIILALLFFGLAFGSFINAYVWREHLSEESPRSKFRSLSVWRGRSVCPNCRHHLAAVDLVPVLSWLWLKGKCRYCKKPISLQYPIVELATTILFMVSYLFWPGSFADTSQIVLFIMWLWVVVSGVALTVYDLKWMLLPNRLIYPLGLFALIFALVENTQEQSFPHIASAAIGSLLFGGFFYAIYQISKGKWIGGGDVRLGFVLGLLLGWQKSLLCLALAAYLGTAVIIGLAATKKYSKHMKLPFGPFLLGAAFITMLWGQQMINWYLRLSGL